VRAIVLVDHGSKVAAANEVVAAVATELARAVPDAIVAFAHQESARPTIAEAIDDVVARGATEITVVPFFLAPGRHATEDVPKLASAAAVRHGKTITVTAPLGSDVSGLAALVLRLLS
jgi:sirohydrochlorin cobaltochelatase